MVMHLPLPYFSAGDLNFFFICFLSSSLLRLGDYVQMHQFSHLSPLPHHNRALCQCSLCPISDVISPVLLWSSSLSPAINVSLQDVGAKNLDPDDIAKV